MNKKFLIVNCLCLVYATALAQSPISLQTAIDTAFKNNLSIKNEKLKTEYQQKLIKTAKIIPPTNVIGDFGQINSFYTDTKLSVTQTISFPKVYSSRKNLLSKEWESSVLNTAVKETELRKQVSKVYYNLLYLQQKEKLLHRTDSLFSEFLEKATLRFNKGESNILEKTTAENQRGQIGLQLNQLKQDMELLQLQFQLLLNTNTVFMPDSEEFKKDITSFGDSSSLTTHPFVQFYQQQKQVASMETQVEKSKLLPELILGYNIMSIRGTGANNKEYNSIPRFQSVQIGLGIPIFNSGQKARINAAKANEIVAANEYELNLKNFERSYKTALLQYQKNKETVAYFETSALKNANIITTTVNNQFINGDINYLDWVILVNQAISIQSDYIEAIKNLNESAVEINSFSNQKIN
jgi:heavy metal efflux system protein